MSVMSKAEKLARFHALVDLGLEGKLQPTEEIELSTLRQAFDRNEAASIAKLSRQMTKEQTRFDASMATIRSQVAALRVEVAADASNRPKSKSASAQ
jgi:uncharacterized damage-inducible protein DinB